MTQKEKAKAYDEALNWMRTIYPSLSGADKEDAEHFFPQLAESDERIRKKLIEIIGYFRSRGIDQQLCEKFLAYLEKQKKQKPILEVFGFKVGDAVRLKDGDGRKHIIKSFEEVEGLHGPNFYHVEFEDNSARSGIYTGKEYPNGYYTQMEKFEKEQKPVDFPTTDEEVKEFLETHPKVEVPEKYKTPDFVFSKQEYESHPIISKDTTSVKPAEWSEADEEKLKAICTYLRDYSRLVKLGDKLRFNEYCDFLESLRPQGSKDSLQTHWKPSEEQMSAFKGYIEDFQARAEAAVGGWNNFDVMIRLYNDLKKL